MEQWSGKWETYIKKVYYIKVHRQVHYLYYTEKQNSNYWHRWDSYLSMVNNYNYYEKSEAIPYILFYIVKKCKYHSYIPTVGARIIRTARAFPCKPVIQN